MRELDVDVDDKLLSLSCLNDDECNVVEVDESLVEDIVNMLHERPPTLRQVRGGGGSVVPRSFTHGARFHPVLGPES